MKNKCNIWTSANASLYLNICLLVEIYQGREKKFSYKNQWFGFRLKDLYLGLIKINWTQLIPLILIEMKASEVQLWMEWVTESNRGDLHLSSRLIVRLIGTANLHSYDFFCIDSHKDMVDTSSKSSSIDDPRFSPFGKRWSNFEFGGFPNWRLIMSYRTVLNLCGTFPPSKTRKPLYTMLTSSPHQYGMVVGENCTLMQLGSSTRKNCNSSSILC